MTMRIGRVGALILANVLVLLVGAGCDDTPTEPENMVDEGSWYRSGYHWAHDGNPYETDHFIVFSDAASLQARQQVADIAEDLMTTLIEDFEIDPETMFKWPAGQSKLHIYAYRDHFEQSFGGKGYYGGLMMFSLDHPIRNTEIGNYTRVVKHELMHAIEGILKGTDNPKIVDVWFTEGIAEHVSGGTSSSGNMTSLAMLDSLTAARGEPDLISIHYYEHFPADEPNAGYLYLYSMFELATRYLLDADGLNRPKSAVRDIMIDAGNGADFAASFEEKFGIPLEQYREEFWPRMRAYLQ